MSQSSLNINRLTSFIAPWSLGLLLLTLAVPVEARPRLHRQVRTFSIQNHPIQPSSGQVYSVNGRFYRVVPHPHRRYNRLRPLRGVVRSSTLINPTIIDSTISDSVLVDPVIINSPRSPRTTIRRSDVFYQTPRVRPRSARVRIRIAQ